MGGGVGEGGGYGTYCFLSSSYWSVMVAACLGGGRESVGVGVGGCRWLGGEDVRDEERVVCNSIFGRRGKEKAT